MKVLSARSVGHACALSSACVFIPVRVQPLHFACICGSRLEGLRVRCSSCRHSFPYHKCSLVCGEIPYHMAYGRGDPVEIRLTVSADFQRSLAQVSVEITPDPLISTAFKHRPC